MEGSRKYRPIDTNNYLPRSASLPVQTPVTGQPFVRTSSVSNPNVTNDYGIPRPIITNRVPAMLTPTNTVNYQLPRIRPATTFVPTLLPIPEERVPLIYPATRPIITPLNTTNNLYRVNNDIALTAAPLSLDPIDPRTAYADWNNYNEQRGDNSADIAVNADDADFLDWLYGRGQLVSNNFPQLLTKALREQKFVAASWLYDELSNDEQLFTDSIATIFASLLIAYKPAALDWLYNLQPSLVTDFLVEDSDLLDTLVESKNIDALVWWINHGGKLFGELLVSLAANCRRERNCDVMVEFFWLLVAKGYNSNKLVSYAREAGNQQIEAALSKRIS